MKQTPSPILENYSATIESSQVWISEENGKPVGLIVLIPEGNVMLLGNIAVHPEAQNRGIGSTLLTFAELQAIKQEMTALRLYTNEAMTENIAYYSRRGFSETHRAVHEGRSRVFFHKQLPTGTGALVWRFYNELWNRWDDSAVDDILADEFAFRGTLGVETRTPDGWRSYRDMIRHGSSDFHNKLIELVVDEPRAAARLLYSGHHDGTLADMPATGKKFEYAGAAFFTARENKLASAWVLGDLSSLRRQLDSQEH